MMRRLFPLAALTTLAAIALVAPASGGQDVLTFVHIKRSFPTFHGTLDSRDAGCVKGRTVKLMEQRKHGEDRLLGSDSATANGRWKVKIAADPGTYYAKVPRLESARRDLACTAAKSRALIVE